MPSDSMPWKVVLPRMVKRLIGFRKRGLAKPITAISTINATRTPASSGVRNRDCAGCPIFIGRDGGRPDELVRRPSLQSAAYLGRLLAGVDQVEEGAIVDA